MENDENPIDSVLINSFPIDQITHLIFCFAWPNPDETLTASDINDIENIVFKCHQNDVKVV